MRFTPQFLDELRARLPVSEVVGRRVKLRKQGREFIGLSPFNKEKSPSFTVNDQKGFFHDFSSGKHGDIFGFVMETEGVAFPEAVERLAQLAGVVLPKVSHEDEQRDARRKTLHRTFVRGSIGRTKEASFVVVNPTHIAIAIRYAPPSIAVPEILVRAADEGAQNVKQIGRAHV